MGLRACLWASIWALTLTPAVEKVERFNVLAWQQQLGTCGRKGGLQTCGNEQAVMGLRRQSSELAARLATSCVEVEARNLACQALEHSHARLQQAAACAIWPLLLAPLFQGRNLAQ